jgi:uncharacterized C2H2 Zn-finger protein
MAQTQTQTFACPDCSEAFPSFSKLKSHMYYAHGRTVSKAILYGAPRPKEETEWIRCPECGEDFQGETAYSKHRAEIRRAQERDRELAELQYQRRAQEAKLAREAERARYQAQVQQTTAPQPQRRGDDIDRRKKQSDEAMMQALFLVTGTAAWFLYRKFGAKK